MLSNYIVILWAHSLAKPFSAFGAKALAEKTLEWLGFEVWDLGAQDVESLAAFDMGFQILVSPFSF